MSRKFDSFDHYRNHARLRDAEAKAAHAMKAAALDVQIAREHIEYVLARTGYEMKLVRALAVLSRVSSQLAADEEWTTQDYIDRAG